MSVGQPDTHPLLLKPEHLSACTTSLAVWMVFLPIVTTQSLLVGLHFNFQKIIYMLLKCTQLLWIATLQSSGSERINLHACHTAHKFAQTPLILKV